MPRVTTKQVEKLKNFLVGQRPSESGEWYMRCPFHNDGTRSASLNMETGQWYCHACAIGGTVKQLMELDNDDSPDAPFEYDEDDSKPAAISYGSVLGYSSSLMANKKALSKLMRRRNLELEILESMAIGWDEGQSAYTIPVFGLDDAILNVRRYQLDPADDRRKIWSVKGYGSPDLYPMEQLEHETLVVCEGEWDALATIQAGIPAVTRTGAAKVWKSKWNHWFADKTVYVIHDMDDAGQQGNRLVYNDLRDVAAACHIIKLPYEVTEKHGKDLSDYWEDHDAGDFWQMIAEQVEVAPEQPVEADVVSINESLTNDLMGKRVAMTVTVDGKSRDDYIIPNEVQLSCSMNFGQRCEVCPMNDLNGEMLLQIEPHERTILRMVGAPEDSLMKELARRADIVPGCKVFRADIVKSQHVSEFNVQPNIDEFTEERSTHSTRNVTVVENELGHKMLNSTVRIEGTIYPHPKDQKNTFLVDSVQKVETSVDRFELTDDVYLRLEKFQTEGSPLAKMLDVAEDLSSNVTRIYMRPEMHVFMDLVFHSVISWDFNNQYEPRGWLDALVIGDSRTGKSEAAERLRAHYRVGQMTTGENSSFAGLVGGVKQVFGNKWEISWGIIPLNDRRLIIMDEVSSLSVEDLGRMSSLRSSGEAVIGKIEGGSTLARTRLLWLSNPREGHPVSYYHHAYEAINVLMGQREDVARFDMAMAVTNEDVAAELINVTNTSSDPFYDQQSCHDLLGWVWSRTRDQVVWEPGVEEYIIKDLAMKMGRLYSETPVPLVQAANVRMKIARIAVAMAARTFSHHPEDEEILYVTKQHARDAAKFLDIIYKRPSFGYRSASKQHGRQLKRAGKHAIEMIDSLDRSPTLTDYLRTRQSTFERRAYEAVVGAAVNDNPPELDALIGWGMVEQTAKAFRVSNELRKLLRELDS